MGCFQSKTLFMPIYVIGFNFKFQSKPIPNNNRKIFENTAVLEKKHKDFTYTALTVIVYYEVAKLRIIASEHCPSAF